MLVELPNLKTTNCGNAALDMGLGTSTTQKLLNSD